MKRLLLLAIPFAMTTAVPLKADLVASAADVHPIGPFTGNLTESWESFSDYLTGPHYLTAPTTIMGGGAFISNSVMSVYLTNSATSFGLGSSGNAKVRDGLKGMGLDGFAQTATITFAKPAVDFGAYWGAATPPWGPESPQVEPTPSTVLLTFGDGTIDTFTYFAADHSGTLEWHGWHFAKGITSISYSGDFVVVDSLQANVVPDADGDGVPDSQDQCPNTPAGAVVDAYGCSIDQLVPCAGPVGGGVWRNHGQYVSAVRSVADAFLAAGLITTDQRDAIVQEAARSNCGK
jgi:hypothetical protein